MMISFRSGSCLFALASIGVGLACGDPGSSPPGVLCDAPVDGGTPVPDATVADSNSSAPPDASSPADAGPDDLRTCADDPTACVRSCTSGSADALGLTPRTLASGDTYTGYAPASYDKTKLNPLVVVFFNGFDTWRAAADASGFGFLVVDANAAVFSDPDSGGSGGFTPMNEAQILAKIDDFSKCYSVDPKRIIAAGHSQGGMEAYTIGLRQSQHFSGIAVTGAGFDRPDYRETQITGQSLLPSQWLIPISNFAGTWDVAAPEWAVRQGAKELVDAGHPFSLHVFDGGHSDGPSLNHLQQMYLDLRSSRAP